MKGRNWTIGLVASLGLHGAGLGALALSIKPEPVPDQPVPKSQFSIEAAEVPRSRADAKPPRGENATESTAPSSAALSGTIPQSEALATPIATDTVAPVRPENTAIFAERTDTAALAPVNAPTSIAISPERPVVATLAPVVSTPTSAAIAPETPFAAALAPVGAPTNTAISPERPVAAALAPAIATPDVISAARSDVETIRPGPIGANLTAPVFLEADAVIVANPQSSAVAAKRPTGQTAVRPPLPAALLQSSTAQGNAVAAVAAAPSKLRASVATAASLQPSETAAVTIGAVAQVAQNLNSTSPIVPSATLVSLPQAPLDAQAATSSKLETTQANPATAPVLPPSGSNAMALAAPSRQQPSIAPDSEQMAPALLPSPSATDLPLPAVAGTASLAWSGGDNTALPATSLAAIAAFTQQGDLAAEASEVRDGIAGILASVPCARLQTTFIPATGQLELRGHIPQDALRGPVLAALRQQVGDAIPLTDNLLILPRPQCGALAGIAGVGLPQSTEQLTNPAVIGEDGFAQNYTYHEGERLHLDLTAPDYDSFVYVDYFVADGTVIHLQPNEIVPLEFSAAKSALGVGRARDDGLPSLELTITPPFGQEIAAAFAASAPLYQGARPIQEPAGPYLEFLKEKVAQARASDPEFKGEWVYFFVSTRGLSSDP